MAFGEPRTPAAAPTGDEVFCTDSIGRSLLEVTARAVQSRPGYGLDRVPVLGRRADVPDDRRVEALVRTARAEALPDHAVGRVDADAVAAWITGHYPAATYPAVVLGSAHGAAAHLAAALGAPWLPTGFAVTVPWPGTSVGDWHGAMDHGTAVARRLLAANPTVTVRQVHDPVCRGPLCASTLTLHVRWRRLPAAYRSFLTSRLEPGGVSLLLRDTRTWPVSRPGPGHTFQIGSPASGWRPADYTMDNPGFRRLIHGLGGDRWPVPSPHVAHRYAESAGEPDLERDMRQSLHGSSRTMHRVLYAEPQALSAGVADLYRQWLRRTRGGGDSCVVETGRLLDPWNVLAGGLVPYWCESASRPAVEAAEWWLAGSDGFESVTVLPEPPGTECDVHAPYEQWRAVARFARSRPHVNRLAMARYPLLPLSTSHAADALSPSRPLTVPSVMPMAGALDGLRQASGSLGLLVV